MQRSDFYQQWGITLDLAIEAHELLRGDTRQEVPGVSEEKETFPNANVTTVTILNEIGERFMGKARGTYITIEAPAIRENNPVVHQEVSTVLGTKLRNMLTSLNMTPQSTVLLVGLGNWEATPDALGPRVVDLSLVTRHLYRYAPQEIQSGLRPVCALAPGVLGITGIETAEIIRGVVDRIRPNLIIAIDALAARRVERISTTIQLADTGINPGSGVGNNRTGISLETMGIPVIAIGVPTVVSAAVIAFEAFGQLLEQNPALNQQINQNTLEGIITNILQPFGGNLTVTPKEIDDLIHNIARIITNGINHGLHQAITPEQMNAYLQ
ncbi:MAG: GPR endopeptidase [Bacillota bacterium]